MIKNEIDHSLNVLIFFSEHFPNGGFNTFVKEGFITIENLTVQLANYVLDRFKALDITPSEIDISEEQFSIEFPLNGIYEQDNLVKLKSESSLIASSPITINIINLCKCILNDFRQFILRVKVGGESIILQELNNENVKEFSELWKRINVPIGKIEYLNNKKVNLILTRENLLEVSNKKEDANEIICDYEFTNGNIPKNESNINFEVREKISPIQEKLRLNYDEFKESLRSPTRSVIMTSTPVLPPAASVSSKLNSHITSSSIPNTSPFKTWTYHPQVFTTNTSHSGGYRLPHSLPFASTRSNNSPTLYTISKIGLSSGVVENTEKVRFTIVPNKKCRRKEQDITVNKESMNGSKNRRDNNKERQYHHHRVYEDGSEIQPIDLTVSHDSNYPPPLSASPFVFDKTENSQQNSFKINEFMAATDNYDKIKMPPPFLQHHDRYRQSGLKWCSFRGYNGGSSNNNSNSNKSDNLASELSSANLYNLPTSQNPRSDTKIKTLLI